MATKNWPHPVLDTSGDDYPDCAFQANIQVQQTKSEFRLSAKFDLGCETIENIIANGDADYVVQVTCPRTAYRSAFTSKSSHLKCEIPEPELRDAFQVAPYVVSRTEFTLKSEEFNPLFGGMEFLIEKGCVLAAAPAVEYYAEKTFDELKNIAAIFEVIRHPDSTTNYVDFDLSGDKISVVLPHAIHTDYSIFRNRKPYQELFVCSFVLPGLLLALESMKAQGAEIDGSSRWKRVLGRKLKQMGKTDLTKEDSYKLAQELLEMPFTRTFAAIREKESEGGKE